MGAAQGVVTANIRVPLGRCFEGSVLVMCRRGVLHGGGVVSSSSESKGK